MDGMPWKRGQGPGDLHMGMHVVKPQMVMMPQVRHMWAGPFSAAKSLMKVEKA